MKRIQQIQKAKSYIDMLSQSIDPTTGDALEDVILQKKDIKDILVFISSVLDELISNNGEVVRLDEPMAFNPESINKELVFISDNPVSVATLANRINKQVNKNIMKNLGYGKINQWLLSNGYLTADKVEVMRHVTKYATTEKAQSLGIFSKNKVDDKTGELKSCVLLSSQAQEFLIQHLEAISVE